MMVLTGEQGAESLRANVHMQQEQGVNTKLIGADEVSEVAPGYNGEGVALACYEPDAGVTDPMATTYSFAQRARDHGATIRAGVLFTPLLHQVRPVTGGRTQPG